MRHWLAQLLRTRPIEPGEPVPDEDLLARYAASRDDAAFELLVWRHAILVAGVCRRFVRDEHLAEDAFQAAFLILARKAGSIRGSNLAGWLFRVARRTALRAQHAAALRSQRESSLTVEPIVEPVPHPMENGELLAVLDEEIARLPERFRLPVLLCYLGGSTTEDAARVLGCPRGTILSRLATARERLALRLTRRGVTVPAAGLFSAIALPTEAAVACLVPMGLVPSEPSRILAQGVLTAMKTNQLLAVAGAVVVAMGLVAGVGLVGVQAGGPGEEVVAVAQPTAKVEQPKAEPPKGKPPTPEDVARRTELTRRAEEERRLDELAGRMAREIRVKERAIQVMMDAHATNLGKAKRTQDSLARLDAEIERLEREILEGETKLMILKKRLEAAMLKKIAEKSVVLSIADSEETLEISKGIVATLSKKRDELEKMLSETTKFDFPAMFKELEPQREALKAIELARVRLQIDRGMPIVGDAKLDAIMKELQELRREVKELRDQKK